MTDADYFHRRERQERERAANSADCAARTIHLELANSYAKLCEDSANRRSPPPLKLVTILP